MPPDFSPVHRLTGNLMGRARIASARFQLVADDGRKDLIVSCDDRLRSRREIVIFVGIWFVLKTF